MALTSRRACFLSSRRGFRALALSVGALCAWGGVLVPPSSPCAPSSPGIRPRLLSPCVWRYRCALFIYICMLYVNIYLHPLRSSCPFSRCFLRSSLYILAHPTPIRARTPSPPRYSTTSISNNIFGIYRSNIVLSPIAI